MIEKGCLDCGHRRICGRFEGFKDITLLLLRMHPQMSDEKWKEALNSVAKCFGSLCIDWLDKSKL